METPNTETSSSSPPMALQPTSAPFSLLSPSTRKSSTSKLDYLYEVNYVPDEQKVTSEDLPLINLYHAFTKPVNPITRSIKQLIKHAPRNVKEYIQSIKFSQCNLPATIQEHFVSLEIHLEYPA